MKRCFPVRAILFVAVVLALSSCGNPLIQLGQSISGSLTSSDNYWVNHDQYGAVTDAGYSDDYSVQTTATKTYTVTFWTSTGKGAFEDKEGGRFQWPNGTNASYVAPTSSNPVTATWTPATSGTSEVDVYCFDGEEPLNYTILITQP